MRDSSHKAKGVAPHGDARRGYAQRQLSLACGDVDEGEICKGK